MPSYSSARLKIWGALLLSASLVSCSSSPVIEQISNPASDPPAISSPERSSSPSIPEEAAIQSVDQPSATPLSTHQAAGKQPDAVPPSVEVSTIQPKSTEPAESLEHAAFQPKTPSLASIKLGASDKDVVKKYGLPSDTYLLPGDKQSVNIWEYEGYSIGLNENDKVVYVEINSSDISTGIHGLLYGMSGSEAAELLGIPNDDHTNVLAIEVSGGWLKLDLDPDTQKVLSLKLLSREI